MIIKVGKGLILINISTGMAKGSAWFFAFFPFKLTIQLSGPLNINWVQQIQNYDCKMEQRKWKCFRISLIPQVVSNQPPGELWHLLD